MTDTQKTDGWAGDVLSRLKILRHKLDQEGLYVSGNTAQLAIEEIVALRQELSAALGYMRNARIDLETGATKATAIKTISGGINRAVEALRRHNLVKSI